MRQHDRVKETRLTILSESELLQGRKMVLCRCICGSEKTYSEHKVRTLHTRSCGCLKRDESTDRFTVHGLSKTPTWAAWVNMRGRCGSKNRHDWSSYGGRGISVSPQWGTFANFLADMGERPNGKTLDRIDVNGNYNKENCRWATWTEQERNRTNNKLVTIHGVTKCIAEWAEFSGIPYMTLYQRIRRGMPMHRLLNGVT